MKKEDWSKVKVNDWLIYSDEYEGVHKARVMEVDIRLYEPGPPSVMSYPYGLTKDTGTVKIQYDTHEEILNLAQLIKYRQSTLLRLQNAWRKYQEALATMESYKGDYTSLIAELKEA